MACSYCGQAYCSGGCLSGQAAQGGQLVIHGGGGILQGGLTFTTPSLPVDNPLHNFLEVIADRTDTDACVAFLEKQKATQIKQIQEIERLRKQYQDDLEKAEKEFLSKCQKYRPSITEELLKRIKGLKAFF